MNAKVAGRITRGTPPIRQHDQYQRQNPGVCEDPCVFSGRYHLAGLAFVVTYVLLDTNQWDRMPALRHRLAAALLYGALQARGDTVIGLPTVVREEVGLHLIEKHDKAMRVVERNLGEARQILGSALHVDRASDDDVREALDARLDELRDVVEEVTVLGDDLAAAGRMVLAYEPPNTRESQQYRDCVLWQTALRLAEDHEVIIVTNDSGFYADKASNELSPDLLAAADDVSASLTAVRTVEDLLVLWGSLSPAVERPELIDLFTDAMSEKVNEALETQEIRFTVRGPEDRDTDIEAFLTEIHDQIIESGKVSLYLEDPDYPDAADSPAYADVEGSATVGISGPEVLEASLDRVIVRALTPHGEPLISSMIFAGGVTAYLGGRPPQPYQFRVRLEA